MGTTVVVIDPVTNEEITFTGVNLADVDRQIDAYFGVDEANSLED